MSLSEGPAQAHAADESQISHPLTTEGTEIQAAQDNLTAEHDPEVSIYAAHSAAQTSEIIVDDQVNDDDDQGNDHDEDDEAEDDEPDEEDFVDDVSEGSNLFSEFNLYPLDYEADVLSAGDRDRHESRTRNWKARVLKQEEVDDRQHQALREEVHRIRFSADRCLSQEQSLLFGLLPPEIRDMIFHYALMDYEDLSKPYWRDTPYGRPGYRAPRKTDTELLRTCQRAYQETWYRPWSASLQTLWFAGAHRRPDSVTTIEKLERQCRRLKRAGVDAEIDHIRIFAQLYALEDGERLQSLLRIEHFKPRQVTICIRHTDWWNWEYDANMYIGSTFVTNNTFPESVKEIRFELESLERRKDQVDSIAEQMKKFWVFKRADGKQLTAHESPLETEMRRGTSTWENRRWVRDEVAPNELSYYMRTLSWTPSDQEMPHAFSGFNNPAIAALKPPRPLRPSVASIDQKTLAMAAIPEGTTSQEAVSMLQEWQERGRPDLRVSLDNHDDQ